MVTGTKHMLRRLTARDAPSGPSREERLRQLPVPQDFIFKIAYDSEARTWRGRFVNLKPRPGEPAVSRL